jgi:hypothetical protein
VTIRRGLLSRHGFDYPMIATEAAKGPAVQALHGNARDPTAWSSLTTFSSTCIRSRQHMPETLLINLMANASFRALAPHPGEGVDIASDWAHAVDVDQARILATGPEPDSATGRNAGGNAIALVRSMPTPCASAAVPILRSAATLKNQALSKGRGGAHEQSYRDFECFAGTIGQASTTRAPLCCSHAPPRPSASP